MNAINSKEYWNRRFEEGDGDANKSMEQSLFFAKIAYSAMPNFLKQDLYRNDWRVVDIGCAEGEGTAYLAKQFPLCQFTGTDLCEKTIEKARERYSNCNFTISDIDQDIMPADVILSFNILNHLRNSNVLIEKMCAAAGKYVLLLFPFEDSLKIEKHTNMFSRNNFPLHIDDFYLERYNIVDCSSMENTMWPGKQILLVYTSCTYRPEQMTIQDICGDREQKMKEDYQRIIAELQDEIDHHQKLFVENQLAFLDICQAISNVQHGKAYRLYLLIKRVKCQLFECGQAGRWDLICWIWGKLFRKALGQPLQHFDPLVSTQQKLLEQSEQNGQSLQSLQRQDLVGIITKRSRQFFIFAGIAFYDVGGGQRSAQIANALNTMGYEVHYIYGFNSSESKRESMYLPVFQHLHIDQYSIKKLAGSIRPNAIFIFENPYGKFTPYLDYANAHGYATVYEHIDNWDSSLGSTFFNKEDYQHFIDTVDYVTVTAQVLGEKIEEAGRHEYLYSANAVDSSLFEPAKSYEKPVDLVTGKRTLLYFGSLWGEWFDWELVTYIAENTSCTINLIGDYAPIVDRISSLPDNIHFLGIKKHENLPAYLQHSDITLLPFKRSMIGKYVSPLKIFEYIAMNKPVLATPLDDIMGYPNVVLSDDKEEWARAVREGIPVRDSTIFTAENSWYARCNQLLDMLGREETCYPTISIVILNRNNMNVVFRCVSSLLTFSSAYDYEIIIVDNDSTDGSYEQLQEKFGDRIKLLKNSKNGCSSGRNLGVSVATGELLLFLDSDQWVIGDHYMDAALDLLMRDSSIGAVSWAAGWFTPGSGIGLVAECLPNRGIKAPWILCRTDVAYLGSGGLLMKRELFGQIGGFDEAYDPTCFEDTDLSLKIRHAGYELAYCPYMNIMHLPHQTTHSGSSEHKKLIKKHGDYFMKKWREIDPALLEYYG